MRIFLGAIHALMGFGILYIGFAILGDYWRTPGYVLLSGGAVSIGIGVGVFARARWVRCLVVLLTAAVTAITAFLLVGSIAWPGWVSLVMIFLYIVFLVLEFFTWRELGRVRPSALVTSDPAEKIN